MNLLYLWSKFVRKVLPGRCVLDSKIDKSCRIGAGSSIVGSTMDRYSYCGYDCSIVNAEIGAFCCMADNVSIGLAEHPMDWVSMSPAFQNARHSGPAKRFVLLDLPQPRKTSIGNDVWIGKGAIIKAGVVIGDGAVIGSGAIVTKDVPAFAVVGGVPARVLRMRFSQRLIDEISTSQWWKMPDEVITQLADTFNSPEQFIKRLRSMGISPTSGGGITS